jgi:isopentenyl diphosphate isomerase/L-lactate dehydrogenase-like FMN-dependent dehydrogenase
MGRADVDLELLTLSDLRSLAATRCTPEWWEYVEGGAEAERTLAENVAAFARIHLRQRILTGRCSAETSTRLLGHPVAHPIVVAPVAYQRLLQEDGEVGMAQAVAATGGAMCLSTFSIDEPADVAAAAGEAPLLLQLYTFRDRGLSDELVAAAVGLGFRAVVLTVDLPVLGPRDRERRVRWTFPEDAVAAARYAIARAGAGAQGEGLALLDGTLDWAYLERLVATAGVPVVVKGVLEPDDARRCVEHGAAAVVVSNHGGRQLDRTPATIDVLAAVAEEVGDAAEVWVDSGIRRGTDVLTCLALGASAVLVGRVPVWGLVAGGTGGARTALALLRDELEAAMVMTGCASIAEIGSHVLQLPTG